MKQEILNETIKAIKGITEDLTIVGPPTVVPETNTAVISWTTDREASSRVLFSATNGFDGISIASHSFAAPVGETILFTMTSAGQTLSFGIGSVAGVWLGAFVGSLIKGHFRWEACEDPRELRRQIFGAAMMGVGAVVALGCSIGQGLSAFSLLAFSAPLTFAAIFVGARFGLTHLIEGFVPAE